MILLVINAIVEVHCPSQWVREFEKESFVVSNGHLFCSACREQLSLKRSIIRNHIQSSKHHCVNKMNKCYCSFGIIFMGMMGVFVGNNWVVLRAPQNRIMERFESLSPKCERRDGDLVPQFTQSHIITHSHHHTHREIFCVPT